MHELPTAFVPPAALSSPRFSPSPRRPPVLRRSILSRSIHRRTVAPSPLITMTASGHELSRPASPLSTSGRLTPSQIDDFFREGYVVVPGLLPSSLLTRVLTARSSVPTTPRIASSPYSSLDYRLHDTSSVFRELALSSPLSAAAAQLTPGDASSPRALCMVKDAFFKLRGESAGCNFHVDDAFFWPCENQAPGPGVNVWVALDEVGEDGGGLAVAPRSFTEDWLDCREAIKPNTCEIHKIAPEKAARLEAVAVAPKFRPGDAIICTRYLFHRAEPFKVGSEGAGGPGIGRYSVRYMPGEAVLNPMDFVEGKLVKGESSTLFDADPHNSPAVDLKASIKPYEE